MKARGGLLSVPFDTPSSPGIILSNIFIGCLCGDGEGSL